MLTTGNHIIQPVSLSRGVVERNLPIKLMEMFLGIWPSLHILLMMVISEEPLQTVWRSQTSNNPSVFTKATRKLGVADNDMDEEKTAIVSEQFYEVLMDQIGRTWISLGRPSSSERESWQIHGWISLNPMQQVGAEDLNSELIRQITTQSLSTE